MKRFEAERDGFLGRLVTGDETWVHCHQRETKKASKEWRHTSSSKPKKFRTQPSAGKVMFTLFWDERGVILEHYMPRGNSVTSATYADLPKTYLRPAIKPKQRGRLSTGVLLQHDNARPHTARSTVATIQDLSFECLPHPPYSPDLAPPVTFMPLDHSKRRWEASLSGQTKSCSRRCTSGCVLSQKIYIFF